MTEKRELPDFCFLGGTEFAQTTGTAVVTLAFDANQLPPVDVAEDRLFRGRDRALSFGSQFEASVPKALFDVRLGPRNLNPTYDVSATAVS